MTQKTLKRQQYHWFWGLRTREQTLWETVEETWKQQPEQVNSVRAEQDLLANKGWIKRFFYWLFNISAYVSNYYKLEVYDKINDLTVADADKVPLKHLYYHWFWGLRDGGQTLWEEAEYWVTQPEVLKSIRQEQEDLAQKNRIIRAFYWVFNISNTTKNHYKLDSYDKICNSSSGEPEMKTSREHQEPTNTANPSPGPTSSHQQTAHEASATRDSTPLPNGGDSATPAPEETSRLNRFFSGWGKKTPKADDKTQSKPTAPSATTEPSSGSCWGGFFKKIKETVFSNPSDTPQPPKAAPPSAVKKSSDQKTEDDDAMLITERLQRPLKVLGMPRNLGELVSFKDIQGQYRKLAFMTHPDKNSSPDAAEIFKVVGAAYETLKDAFEKKQSDTTQMESTDPTFNTYMAETQAYFKKHREEMRQATAEYCARADAHIQRTDAQLKQMGEHLEQMGEKQREIGAQQAKQKQELDEYQLEMQRIAQLFQSLEQANVASGATPSGERLSPHPTSPTAFLKAPEFRSSPVLGGSAAQIASPVVPTQN